MKPSKAADFFIGMLGIYAVSAVVAGFLTTLHAYSAAAAAPAVLSIALGIASFVRQRPFITLGIVAAWVIPALAFGACMVLYGMHGL